MVLATAAGSRGEAPAGRPRPTGGLHQLATALPAGGHSHREGRGGDRRGELEGGHGEGRREGRDRGGDHGGGWAEGSRGRPPLLGPQRAGGPCAVRRDAERAVGRGGPEPHSEAAVGAQHALVRREAHRVRLALAADQRQAASGGRPPVQRRGPLGGPGRQLPRRDALRYHHQAEPDADQRRAVGRPGRRAGGESGGCRGGLQSSPEPGQQRAQQPPVGSVGARGSRAQ